MNDVQAKGLIAEFVAALEEERHAQKEMGFSQRVPIFSAHWSHSTGEHHIYKFRTGQAIKEPPDSRVQWVMPHATVQGSLVSSKGLSATVAFSSYLGERSERGVLAFETSFLLERLAQTLLNLNAEDFNFASAEGLFTALEGGSRHGSGDLWKKVAAAHRLFIWGPAGTGKTQTLAEIAARLLQEGERVLIVANTHRAVNNGLLRTLREWGKLDAAVLEKPGRVLRYGLLEKDLGDLDLLERLASPERFMRLHHRDLWERRTTLALQNKAAKDQWEEWRLNKRLETSGAQELRQGLLQVEADTETVARLWQQNLSEALGEVQGLACTLSQVFLTPQILRQRFSTVIIDEASMASLPALYVAAGLASRRVIVLGDFRQLPPICTQKTERIRTCLGRDIFETAGLPELVHRHQLEHPEVHMLRIQRRMVPALSALVGEVFYEGLLLDDPARKPSSESTPGGEPAVVFYDSHEGGSWCLRRSQDAGGSRVNIVHAHACVYLAEQLLLHGGKAGPKSVAVITPYREQARFIHHLLDDRGISEHVNVATVHQFQGEERDVIIFDTVDAAGFPPSRLLQGEMGLGAARLLNVALTRARERLLIVGDRSYLKEHLAPEACLRTLLAKIEESKTPIVALREILPGMNKAWPQLEEDLSRAESFVFLSLPFALCTIDARWLELLHDLAERGVRILIDTLSPAAQRQSATSAFRGIPQRLRRAEIVMVCHEPGEAKVFPEAVLIDNRACFISSQGFEKGGIRLTGRLSLQDLSEFFGVGLLREMPPLVQDCPMCAGAMVFVWNRRQFTSSGDFFAACSEGCGYRRPLLRGERHHHDHLVSERGKAPVLANPHQRVLPGFAALAPRPAGHTSAAVQRHLDPCPLCKSSTSLRFSSKQYLFIGCSRFPQCTFKRPYQEPCASCRGHLLVRRSAQGIFLGCSNYPRCRATKDLPDDFGSVSRDVPAAV